MICTRSFQNEKRVREGHQKKLKNYRKRINWKFLLEKKENEVI